MITAVTVSPGKYPTTFTVGQDGVTKIEVGNYGGNSMLVISLSSGQYRRIYNTPFHTIDIDPK